MFQLERQLFKQPRIYEFAVMTSSQFIKFLILELQSSKSGPASEEPAYQCRRYKRCGFDPWVRKIPQRRNGNQPQYSCLKNPTDRGVWWVHRVAKCWTQLSVRTYMSVLMRTQTELYILKNQIIPFFSCSIVSPIKHDHHLLCVRAAQLIFSSSSFRKY